MGRRRFQLGECNNKNWSLNCFLDRAVRPPEAKVRRSLGVLIVLLEAARFHGAAWDLFVLANL
jgi:hypothetical protein